MRGRKWADPSFPKENWKPILIRDLGEDKSSWRKCHMGCGQSLRYAHVFVNEEYGEIEIGRSCANNLLGGYDALEEEIRFRELMSSETHTLDPNVGKETPSSEIKISRKKKKTIVKIDRERLINDIEYFVNLRWAKRIDKNMGGMGCENFTPEEYADASYNDAIQRYKVIEEEIEYIWYFSHQINIFSVDNQFRCLIRINYYLFSIPYYMYPLKNDVFGLQYWPEKSEAKREAFYLLNQIIKRVNSSS